MFYHAKNGNVRIGSTDMDYVSFGKGKDNLVMLPGLGDGLTTVKGKAAVLAFVYRIFGKNYRVYIFSRKNNLEEGCSTRDMAKDQAEAMRALGLSHAKVVGISQGGMIAQYLAIDYPDLVEKLVLAVTSAKQNEMIQEAVGGWIAMAEQGAYKALMIDTAEKSYTEGRLKRYRLIFPFLGAVGKPRDFTRFLIQAKSCLYHNAYAELDKILCSTLIIGGDCDKIVGAGASRELADGIGKSELFLYNGFGHGVYEEAEDFNGRVMEFLGR